MQYEQVSLRALKALVNTLEESGAVGCELAIDFNANNDVATIDFMPMIPDPNHPGFTMWGDESALTIESELSFIG